MHFVQQLNSAKRMRIFRWSQFELKKGKRQGWMLEAVARTRRQRELCGWREVIGERAPQWAEPSVDEAQKCGLNQSNLMKLRFLRYTY